MKLLGNHFDIHTGGEDLSRVHHANEIAQSEPITGAPWVNTWLHYSFLLDKSGEKMAKSKGEFLGMDAVRNRGYDPMVYRYFVAMGHYQSQLAFSWETMDATAKSYANLVRRVADLINDSAGNVDQAVYDKWHDEMVSVMSDNLKTASVLVMLQEFVKSSDINNATKLALVRFVDDLLGLQFIVRAKKLAALENETAPAEIIALADARAAAKANKDWANADALRAEIDAAGWTVLDGKDGYKIVKKA
jgi:cysteinyl-tRNA synthetase